MANRRVRVVRSLKIDGKAVFCAPGTTPKGAISSEFVIYKGRKLKFPPAEGRWYLRWEEGSKPAGVRARWRNLERSEGPASSERSVLPFDEEGISKLSKNWLPGSDSNARTRIQSPGSCH